MAARRSPSGGEAAGSRYRQIGRVSERYEVSVVAHEAGLYRTPRTVLNHIRIAAHHVPGTNFHACMDEPVGGDHLLSRMA